MKRILRSNWPVAFCLLIGLLLVPITFAAPSGVSVPSAWQITDNSSAGGSTLSYTTNLTAALRTAATNLAGGFCYTVKARFANDFSSATESMTMNYSLGSKRFLIWWDLDSNSNLTARLEGGITYTLTTNGLGTAMYHTHEIIYHPTNGTASYVVDGNVMTNNWPGNAGSFTEGHISWGAGSSTGKGQVNFNRVTFTITNNSVASYDGYFTSLNPTTKGWTENLGSSTTVSNVPGDLGVMLAIATTALGNFSNSNPILKAQAYAPDAPMLGWFEWGTDTNYGNVTPVQDVGFKVGNRSFNATLTNLLGGPDYHYRAVASNVVGVVKGEDNTFNLRFLRNYALPEHVFGGAGSTHTRFTSVGDYDNDGWLDLLITGKSPQYNSGYSILLRNMGDGTFSNVTSVLAPGLPNLDGVSAWGDFDTDGRLDFLITGDDGTNTLIQLWRNTGSGFTNVPIPGVTAVAYGTGLPRLACGDYDNDGRLDFLIQGSPASPPNVFQLWRNTGSGFTKVSIPGLPTGLQKAALAWSDYDNDGLRDFLAVGFAPSGDFPELWRNTGGSFTNVPLPGVPNVSATEPAVAFGDYHNDGRLDFLLAGTSRNPPFSSAFSQLWRNTSAGFTNVPIPGLVGLPGGMVAWGDCNNDGQLDFVIAGNTNNSFSMSGVASQFWENTGSGFTEMPLLVHPDDAPNGWIGYQAGSLVLADFNHDGRLDILLSGRSEDFNVNYFGPRLFLNNLAVGSNQPPGAPTGLSATITGTRVNLHWNPPSDDHTPAAGLSYNVRIGTTPGGCDIISPPALPDGRLTLSQIGTIQSGAPASYNLSPGRTYYWSVQAVDGGLAGSPFASEQQFNTPPILINPVLLGSGQFQFSYTNLSSATYEVLGTTNAALPVVQWQVLGLPISLGGGLYRFTDSSPVAPAQRFYLLRKQ